MDEIDRLTTLDPILRMYYLNIKDNKSRKSKRENWGAQFLTSHYACKHICIERFVCIWIKFLEQMKYVEIFTDDELIILNWLVWNYFYPIFNKIVSIDNLSIYLVKIPVYRSTTGMCIQTHSWTLGMVAIPDDLCAGWKGGWVAAKVGRRVRKGRVHGGY